MKKLVLVSALAIGVYGNLLLLSCKKEVLGPQTCGIVVSDNPNDFSVMIRNNMTGNVKKFILPVDEWIKAKVNTEYCVQNTITW